MNRITSISGYTFFLSSGKPWISINREDESRFYVLTERRWRRLLPIIAFCGKSILQVNGFIWFPD